MCPTERNCQRNTKWVASPPSWALNWIGTKSVDLSDQGSGTALFVDRSKPQSKGKVLFILPFANDLSLGNFYWKASIQSCRNRIRIDADTCWLSGAKPRPKLWQKNLTEWSTTLTTHVNYDLLFELASQGFPVVTLWIKHCMSSFIPSCFLADNFEGGQLATGTSFGTRSSTHWLYFWWTSPSTVCPPTLSRLCGSIKSNSRLFEQNLMIP